MPLNPMALAPLSHGAQRVALACCALAAMGCGGSAFVQCERMDMARFNLLICPAKLVDRHCWHTIQRWERKHGAPVLTDDGKARPGGSLIRGCTDYKRWSKPSVFISREYRECARHEAAHAQKLGDPMAVLKDWPCLGQGK